MQWTEAWVLEKLRQTPVPVHVVLGGGDTWLPPDWQNKVTAASLPLSVIAEASHNFTGPQEFEFQELILRLLEEALDRNE
jgi:pimeloyl-ACP methyl ester carboxylesterase